MDSEDRPLNPVRVELELSAARKSLARARRSERRAIEAVEALERGLRGMFAWMTGTRAAKLDAAIQKAQARIAEREALELRVAQLEDALQAFDEAHASNTHRRATPTAVRRPAVERALEAVRAFQREPVRSRWAEARMAVQDLQMLDPRAGIGSMPALDDPGLEAAVTRLCDDLEVLRTMVHVDPAPGEGDQPIPLDLLDRAEAILHSYAKKLDFAIRSASANPSPHRRVLSSNIPLGPSVENVADVDAATCINDVLTARDEAMEVLNVLASYSPKFERALDLPHAAPDLAWLTLQRHEVGRIANLITVARATSIEDQL